MTALKIVLKAIGIFTWKSFGGTFFIFSLHLQSFYIVLWWFKGKFLFCMTSKSILINSMINFFTPSHFC
jgi:hypothetical protein